MSEKEMGLEWLKSYEKEHEKFSIVESTSRDKLFQALNSSKILGIPNSFRTAICFELLGEIVDTFDRYKHITRILLDECIQATYCHSDQLMEKLQGAKGPKARVFFEHSTYYVELSDLLEHRHLVDRDMKRAHTEFLLIMQQLKNKEFMLNKTAERWGKTVLHETFYSWLKVTKTEKATRVALERTMHRWKQRHVKLILAEWKSLVEGDKRQCTTEKLDQLKKQWIDCQLQQEELEKEIVELKAEQSALHTEVGLNQLRLDKVNSNLNEIQKVFEQSNELVLQKRVHQWGKLCMAFVNLELQRLEDMLGAVDSSKFQNVSVLLHRDDEAIDLLHLPVDTVLLRWCNYHLKRVGSTKVMQSFSSDLKSCEILGRILTSIQCSDEEAAAGEATFHFQEEDLDVRERDVLQALRQLDPPCPEFLSTGDISNGDKPDLMFVLLSFLFVKHSGLVPSVIRWEESIKALEEAKNIWKSINSCWFKVPLHDVPEMAAKYAFGSASVQQLSRAKTSLLNAIQMVQYACAKRASDVCLWKRVSSQMEAASWDVLIRRGRGAVYKMPDLKEAREKAMYTTLNVKKVTLVFKQWGIPEEEMPREIEKILAIYRDKYDDLRRIFTHYAASDVGDAYSMSMDEFYAFLKDSKMLSKNLPLSEIQKIFKVVNDEGEGFNDPLNPDFEFTPGEFVEAIIHISERRSRGTKKENTSLSSKVKRCLADYILPNACRSNLEYFRSRLARSDCKELYAENKDRLQHCYRKYAESNGCLSTHGFQRLLEDGNVFSQLFTKQDMQVVFTKIQEEDSPAMSVVPTEEMVEGADVQTNGEEITYTDFCSALAAIAVYRNSDPFIELPIKIEELLEHMMK